MNIKRIFDVFFSLFLILFLFPLLLFLWVLSAFYTKSNGIFLQNRIGQHGKIFKIIKFRTIIDEEKYSPPYCSFLRKHKLDELPQLFNILLGSMSFVGPRPDIEGYYDSLEGENRKILTLKPGITSEASIKYYNEEEILEKQENPLGYNNNVIFPDKVKINLEYYYNQNILLDIKIIIKTIFKIK